MILRTTAFHIVIFLFFLSSHTIAQFSQQQDTVAMDQKAQDEIAAKARIIAGIHRSNHIEDTNVYNANDHFLNNTDPTRLMQTKTGGLSVNANSYTPGASTSVILRGYRSILGNNEPLIILDGLPIDNMEWGNTIARTDQSNRLIDLNPNDIESIDVIKSAAGRAKYGIVGGNGVIVIETKEGKEQKTEINIRSSISIDQISSTPALQNTFAQGRTIDGERVHRGPEFLEEFSWGPEISTLEYDGTDYQFDKNGRLVSEGFGNGTPANSYDPLEFFQSGLSTNLNASVNGGTEKLKYYFSGGYNNSQGVIPTNSFKRFNFNSNLNYDLNNKISLGFNALISSSKANRTQKGSNINGVMLGLLRTAPTFDNTNGSSDPLNDTDAYILEDGSQRSYRSGVYTNPYWTLNKNAHDDKVLRSILSLSVNYEIVDNVNLLLSVGSDQYSDKRTGGLGIQPFAFNGQSNGFVYERISDYSSQNVDVSLHHKYKPLSSLELNTTVGFNYNVSKRSFDIKEGRNLIQADDLSIDNAMDIDSNFDEIDRKRMGTLVAIEATYNDYLHLDGSIRQDYSNKFGSETNGYLSYGLGLGLELDKMLFGENDSDLHSFVLHASIGKFGNDVIDGNAFNTFNNTTTLGGDGFLDPIEIDNPELSSIAGNEQLTAEAISVTDVGLQYSFMDGKYMANFTYYIENADDLVINNKIALSSGFSSIYQNMASIENKGFEVSLSTDLVETDKLQWNLSLGFNKNTSIVSNLNNGTNSITLGGLQFINSQVINDEAYGVIVGSGFQTNDFDQLLVDDVGFPIAAFNLIVADPNPDWTMYINNNITIGDKINLSASIDIKSGGEQYCGTCSTLDYFGRTERAAAEVGQTMLFAGVTQNGLINETEAQLAPIGGDYRDFYRVRYGFGGLAEMAIYDASWVRLRTLSLDYDITDIFKNKHISNFTIGVYVNNLFVISDYPSIDPETNLLGNSNARGLEYYNNPGTRQYGAVVNLSF